MIKIFKNKNNEAGFVALVSAVIIASTLLIITVALNLSGFLGRSNIMDTELKDISLNLAEACGDKALLNLADNPQYNPNNEIVPVNLDNCTIISVENNNPSSGQTTIKTAATPSNSSITTNIKIIIDTVTLSVISWEEVPKF